MLLCKREVVQKDVSILARYFPVQYEKFGIWKPSGEHYKLLAHLADQLEGQTIIDAGTLTGISALTLGANRNNTVLSYDIDKVEPAYRFEFPQIRFKQLDINLETADVLLSAPLIVLDIDPHDGSQERQFFERLRAIRYRGVVVLDDIHLNARMDAFWGEIEETRFDVTDCAHWSGTGIADFSGRFEVHAICPKCRAVGVG